MIDRKALNREKLDAYAQASRRRLIKSVRDAMSTITKEIEASDGIYPYGKLTQREICVRAGITQAALQKPTHKNTTLVEVNAWIKQTAEAMRTSKSVRKVVNGKLEMLKQRNADIKQKYHECELRLIDANAQIAKRDAQIAVLTAARESQITSIETARKRRLNKP